MTDLHVSAATAARQFRPSPSRTAAESSGLSNDEWVKSILAEDDCNRALTDGDGVPGLEEWLGRHPRHANAPRTIKERLRRHIPARTFVIIWGPTVRNLVLRPQSWRPSTVCALAAVMGVDLIEGSQRMARWRGVVDARLS